MNFELYLRKLAKQQQILNQFAAAKEINNINLFKNNIEFSKLQHTFLSYLYFYYNLYQDIYMQQVSNKVTDDELYEDAYFYYKTNKKTKLEKTSKGKRKLEGIFSSDNKINFPKVEVIKNG